MSESLPDQFPGPDDPDRSPVPDEVPQQIPDGPEIPDAAPDGPDDPGDPTGARAGAEEVGP
ncbi:MAG: hypothetical protein ABWY33_09900 [Cellulomonas sp.]